MAVLFKCDNFNVLLVYYSQLSAVGSNASFSIIQSNFLVEK